jgi:hypothetical protein
MGEYAIEVDKAHAETFSIPGATILERGENEDDDTVVFFVRSKGDLRWSGVIDLPGVRAIEPL